MSLRSLRVAAALATLVAVLSCGGADNIAPPTSAAPGTVARPSDSTLLAGLYASGPVAGAYASLDRIATSHSSAANVEVSWVSVVPGTVPDGTSATITNLRTAQRITVAIVDGGFDPEAIPASLGDSLQVSVSRAGKPDAAAVMSLSPRPGPRIVRSRPPRGQTDAPLNTVITLVFTEPLDPVSVNSTSVALTAATSADPIAGDVRMLPSSAYVVEFTPDTLLMANTTYSLAVSGVRNLAGVPLDAPTSITFTTTGATSSTPVASVTLSPDSAVIDAGDMLWLVLTRTSTNGQGRIDAQTVMWTSSAPNVATVIPRLGTLIALAPGTAVITARSAADGKTATARITVNPAATPIGAIVADVCSDYGECGLYAVEPDGTNGRYLTASFRADNHRDSDPVWSPDGRFIAFASDRGCDRTIVRFCYHDLYVMPGDGSGIGANGSGLRSLTAGSGLDVSGMSWSPDGSRIVFAASLIPASLYVMNADGSGLRRLVSGSPGTVASWPDWSPDGSRIVYNVISPGDTATISVVNADGSNAVSISTVSPVDGDFRPHWSPDGTRIVFTRQSGRTGPNYSTSRIFVMNADGSNVTPLTQASHWAWHPVWSPDGRSIAFMDNGSFYSVVVMNANGTGERLIATPCCDVGFMSAISWRRTAAAVAAPAQSRAATSTDGVRP